VMLVKNGTVLPHIELAQTTMDMDWSKLNLVVYSTSGNMAEGKVCLPENNELHTVSLTKNSNGKFELDQDPLNGKVKWNIVNFQNYKP